MLLRMAGKRNQARSQCQNVKCKEKVVETILFVNTTSQSVYGYSSTNQKEEQLND